MTKAIPTCNEKAINETVVATGESKRTIESVIGHYSAFIAKTMKEGGFESVRVPHFGIFQAKLKELQWRALMQSLPKTITRKP